MKTKLNLLKSAWFLATVSMCFSQPVITNQPQTQAAAPGATATFDVGARSTEPLAYQWQKNPGNGFSDLADRTNAALVLTNVQPWDACDYRVAVTNSTGARTSAVAHLYVLRRALVTTNVVLDNFDDNRLTGWTPLSSGQVQLTETNQQFKVRGYWPGVQTRSWQDTWSKGWLPRNWRLTNGQTLEWRVDLVGMNQFTTMALNEPGNWGTVESYALCKGHNFISIGKYWAPQGVIFFSCDAVVIKNTNVVLALAMSLVRADVILTARVLEKDNLNAVLYERRVVDTPGIDRSVTTAEFKALTGMQTVLVPDVTRAPLTAGDNLALEICQYNYGNMPAAEVIYDNLELWTSLIPVTRYVDANSANPTPPYTNWFTAATNIQDAVDAALAGDEVVVTNGIYATGGRAVGTNVLVNRVAVDKPLTLRSVNGPEVTIIQGYQVPGTTNGDGAIRCVYLADGAGLSGFTLTNGATRVADEDSTTWRESGGGGVWCESTNAVVSNCLLTGNSAFNGGGGVYRGTLTNCTLTRNSAMSGGGACDSTLTSCTLSGNSAVNGGGACGGTLNSCAVIRNSADYGGGAFESTLNNCTIIGNSAESAGGVGSYCGMELNNCIVYCNTARDGTHNYRTANFNYSCTTPPPAGGVGNISADPQLASGSHLSAGSPCRGAGSAAYVTGTDIDGEAWGTPPSIGCDEYHAGAVTGPLTVGIVGAHTNVSVGFPESLAAAVEGRTTGSVWEFGDGVVMSNRPCASHAWALPGDYPVVLGAYNESHPEGVWATVTVHVVAQPIHYVAAASTNPLPPYASWGTAAGSIQDAVDAVMLPGALVLVSNGLYATGGRAVQGTMTNRVVVQKPLILRSVNGPQFTTIQGYQVPGTTNGDGAIRCVYLADGASLSGFTLTNGATRVADNDYTIPCGGGVWCESMNAVVSNCLLTGNSAFNCGGGVYGGTLTSCTLAGNSAGGGGGAWHGTLNSCAVIRNSADSGGGALESTLNNCTVTGNMAVYSGGVYEGALNNCIVYFNTASTWPNYNQNDWAAVLSYCCTTPMPTNGVGNITNAPLFVDYAGGDLRLLANSPCINAGFNGYAPSPTDLDGNRRIVSGTVDIGAYEFQGPGSVISYAWLQQYGLPTDGSADLMDPDRDGMNNWQEWRCQTDPTNALSVLRLLSAARIGTNVTVTWQSTAGVTYVLERSTNLLTKPPFSLLATNLPGQPDTTSFTDTNAARLTPLFYRVGVGN